jgi:ribose transport system substrate-binding protein
MANQLPIKGVDKYWAEYAGVDDVLNGQVSGKLLLQARKAMLASGAKLHSKGGNVIIVRFPAGYGAGDNRITGFEQAIKGSGIKILGIQAAGFDPTTGFKIGSQLIAANKSKGIDFVYAENDALADGVIQALEQAGFTPGKDVMVIGGTCHGNLTNLIQGKEFGTGLQAAFLEGVYDVNVLVKYLETKKVLPGQNFAPSSRMSIPPVGSVYKYNFIPNPSVTSKQVNTVRLWGYSMRQLCTY